MRVLFYNWADPQDPEGRGGGVSVYQRNLLDGFARMDGVEVAMLSSGLSYDLVGRKPRVVPLASGPVARYALVNSGTIAPAHAGFGNPAQLDHPATAAAFAAFVERTGPWDVIHFNNLEGLPTEVLALRDRWPGTRFVLSLHNYYPICPQVNLWFAERENCESFDAGRACTRCLTARPEERAVRTVYATGWSLSRLGMGPGSALYRTVARPVLGFAWRSVRRVLRWRHARRERGQAVPAPAAAPTAGHQAPAPLFHAEAALAFAQRRARMVGQINAHCDAVLCVSDRVRQIALTHGIHASRTTTLRIGSREAAEWHHTRPRPAFLLEDGTLSLAYLGYMRRDKGFYFLMRALAALPPEMAARLRLTIAAGRGEADAMAAMEALRPKLAELRHVDGYSHDDLNDLLRDVTLGIVPPIWEDNLPQVAIEMHARHIPLLTSDRGGAQELGHCPDLVFRADDVPSFRAALGRVLDGSVTPAHYWAQARPPVDLPSHLNALLSIYRGDA